MAADRFNTGQLLVPLYNDRQLSAAVTLLLTCLLLVAPSVAQEVAGCLVDGAGSLRHGASTGGKGWAQHKLGAVSRLDALVQQEAASQQRLRSSETRVPKETSCPANVSDAFKWIAGSTQSNLENKCYDAWVETPKLVEWCPAKSLAHKKPLSKRFSKGRRVASASVSFLDWIKNWLVGQQIRVHDHANGSQQSGLSRDSTEATGLDELNNRGEDIPESGAAEFQNGVRSLTDVTDPPDDSAINDPNLAVDSSREPLPQRLTIPKEKVEVEDAVLSSVFRLTHRAKAETSPPKHPRRGPPLVNGSFSNTDHEHLLAADVARRALISSSKIPLGGSTVPLGYYFAEIALGTPPQKFTMIVDTGSAIMYVPAKECASCGRNHESPPYDRAASSTYSPLLCSSAKCTTTTPATCPSPDSPCPYQQHYSEGSSTSGTIAVDVLRLPGILGTPKIMFGCQTQETGLLYTQTADGIIGLGRGPGSLITQLAQQRAVDDAFSLCFGGVEGGGAMVFGSVGNLPGTVWIPMLPRTSTASMYFTEVYGLRVAGSALRLDPSFLPMVAMIDSGTTYTYLPAELYSPLVTQLLQAVRLPLVKVPKRSLSGACWMKVTAPVGPSSDFPSMSFVFAGDAIVEVPPENYLFKHPSVAGAVCLGIFSSGQHGATIGGISVHNLLVTYDRAHQLFGFAPLNCSAVADGTLTLPKPKTSFPNLSALNKTQSANGSTDAPAYARIPFRNAYHVDSSSSLTSPRDSPNPWAATLEGVFFEESSPGEEPPGPPPGTSAPSPAPVESNPGARNPSGAEGGPSPASSTAHFGRPSTSVVFLLALLMLLVLLRL